MPVDWSSFQPAYMQVADDLRAKIVGGELPPEYRLPAESHIAQQEGVSRDTVRKAIAVLRREGLIRTTRRGSVIRTRPEVKVVAVARGDRIESRMPTDPERREHDMDEGVPVLGIVRAGTEDEEIYP